MEKYLFMRPLLALLSQDRFLCRTVAITLKVTAVLLVLFSLTMFFNAGKRVFDLPTNGILGGILFEVFFVLAVYAAVHALFIRAEQIDETPGGQYIVLRLAPMLLRGLGEAYAAFVGLVAVGGGIFVWFTNRRVSDVLSPVVRPLFPSVSTDTSFAGGIGFMLSGLAASVAVLLVSYLLAEALLMMARSVKAVEPSRTSMEERFRTRVS